MTLYADGGQMSTKPYVAGGAYINRMSDYCGGCKFQPNERLGDTACPMTGGYWAFLQANQGKLANNPRIAQQLRGLSRLGNAEQISIAEARRSNL
jgi:deoxyribodipyrimidine photolyase-related protein